MYKMMKAKGNGSKRHVYVCVFCVRVSVILNLSFGISRGARELLFFICLGEGIPASHVYLHKGHDSFTVMKGEKGKKERRRNGSSSTQAAGP